MCIRDRPTSTGCGGPSGSASSWRWPWSGWSARCPPGCQRSRTRSSWTPMSDAIELEVGGRTVRLSSPDRVYFPEHGWTKLDVAQYYMSVGDGIVRALRERPCMLHRFPKGLPGGKVHQKRLPAGAPEWVETVQLYFPRYGLT